MSLVATVDSSASEHTHFLATKTFGSLDGLLPRNQELHDLLTQLGIEHEYEVVPGVAHDSPLYYRQLGSKPFAFHQKSLGLPAGAAGAQ